MKLGLQLRLKQTLAPQLIQSLKMLQMPILKLEQTLRHELSVNPMLEEVEPVETPETTETDSESSLPQEEQKIDPKLDKIDWENYLGDDQEYKFKTSFDRAEEDDNYERVQVMEKSLYEHLLEQLSYLKLTPEEHLIGEYIIGNISPKGYLVCTSQEMAEELKVPLEAVEKIVKIIQSFDPSGSGLSRSARIPIDTARRKRIQRFSGLPDSRSIRECPRPQINPANFPLTWGTL